jgi:cohesin complex subunit SA-1/2
MKKAKAATAPAPKRPRKQAAPTNGDAGPAEVQGENFKTDSAFFSEYHILFLTHFPSFIDFVTFSSILSLGNGLMIDALLSADIALAPLVEDWVENYQTTTNDDVSERAAVHELILFVIRACGLAADVTEDEAMDVDGVLEAVDTIQEESVRVSYFTPYAVIADEQVAAAAYPLISKTKALKPFKTNLDLFISLLIKTMAISDTLYEEAETTTHTLPLISILLTWLNTMSSSPLRPIRHTSTYIALKIVTELCVQAGDISKELNLKQRQKDMEAKKGGVGPAFQKKMKEAEAKVKEVHGKKVRLEEIMKDSFDT